MSSRTSPVGRAAPAQTGRARPRPRATAAGRTPIARDTGVPLYLQLVAQLQQRIRDGHLAPGDPLPSEAQLKDEFGVGRVTVRSALRELEREGLVLKSKGKGTVVRGDRVAQSLGRFRTVTEVLREYGYAREIDVLFHGVVAAPAHIAGHLEIAEGEPCALLRRRHSMRGVPVAISVKYMPMWFARRWRSRDLVEKTAYELVSERDLARVEGDRVISAALADDVLARELGTGRGGPVIMVESRSRISGGPTFESSVFYFHPQRYSLRFHFTRGSGGAAEGTGRSLLG